MFVPLLSFGLWDGVACLLQKMTVLVRFQSMKLGLGGSDGGGEEANEATG